MGRDLIQRAEKEEWAHDRLLHTLFAEEVAHRRGTRLTRAVRAAKLGSACLDECFPARPGAVEGLGLLGSAYASPPPSVGQNETDIYKQIQVQPFAGLSSLQSVLGWGSQSAWLPRRLFFSGQSPL